MDTKKSLLKDLPFEYTVREFPHPTDIENLLGTPQVLWQYIFKDDNWLDMRYPPANPAQPNPTHRWAGWVGSVKTHGYHGLKLANPLGYGLTHSLGWGRLLGWVGMLPAKNTITAVIQNTFVLESGIRCCYRI